MMCESYIGIVDRNLYQDIQDGKNKEATAYDILKRKFEFDADLYDDFSEELGKPHGIDGVSEIYIADFDTMYKFLGYGSTLAGMRLAHIQEKDAMYGLIIIEVN